MSTANESQSCPPLFQSARVLATLSFVALPAIALAAGITLRYPSFNRESAPIVAIVACAVCLAPLIAFAVVCVLVVRESPLWRQWVITRWIIIAALVVPIGLVVLVLATFGDPAT